MHSALLTKAYDYALYIHRDQRRKSYDTAYAGHLKEVQGIVERQGGNEMEVIAAILHDAAEDQGGLKRLEDIYGHFGVEIASIVAECSDTFDYPKTVEDIRTLFGNTPPEVFGPPYLDIPKSQAPKEDWDLRKTRRIQYIETSASLSAVRVIIADKTQNMMDTAVNLIHRQRKGMSENDFWKSFTGGREKTLRNYYLTKVALEKRIADLNQMPAGIPNFEALDMGMIGFQLAMKMLHEATQSQALSGPVAGEALSGDGDTLREAYRGRPITPRPSAMRREPGSGGTPGSSSPAGGL